MRLRVVEPCHEDWNALDAIDDDGERAVRHCRSCDRHVHDLSQLSERDAFGYAMLHGRNGICARLRLEPARSFALAPPSTLTAAALGALVVCATPLLAAEAEVCEPRLAVVASVATQTTAAPSAPSAPSAPPPSAPPPTESAAPKVVVVMMGGVSSVPRVEFAHNATKPSRESLALLGDVAHVMRDRVDVARVCVIGSAATNEKNPQALSLHRAQRVVDALVAQGIAIERLEVRADGVTRPMDDNKTSRGRARNRNVSFEIAPSPGSCTPH